MNYKAEAIKKAKEISKEYNFSKDNVPTDNLDIIINENNILLKYEDLPDNISGALDLRDKEKPIMLINSSQNEKRQNFTKAHELAHYFLQKDDPCLHIDDPIFYRSQISETGIDIKEVQANTFAAELLMPEDLINELLKMNKTDKENINTDFDDDIFSEISKTLKVSLTALTFRISTLINKNLIKI